MNVIALDKIYTKIEQAKVLSKKELIMLYEIIRKEILK